jgi:putative IMPACT (imprinted ancient) family translation regulator
VPTYTLRAPVSAELEIKKSRFIGLAVPVEDRAAAMDVIARLRAEHPAATHVCWALLAGGQSGMSDDGEPSGTAGRPILEVLRHHDLDGALMHAERVERIASTTLTLATDYADEARIRRWIDDGGYTLVDAAYDAGVTLTVRLPVTDEAAARVALRDLTQGRVAIT